MYIINVNTFQRIVLCKINHFTACHVFRSLAGSFLRKMSSKVVETDLEQGILHNDEWVKRWEVKNVNFHKAVNAAILDKKEKEIFEGKTKSVFAPLCGKSLDLKWMYDRGHTVVGVEIAEQAVQEFYQEHNIEYDIEEIDIGKVYKSKDDKVNLYVADLYDVKQDIVGQFDIVYDCRSLVAINLEDHQLYRDLMLSLMKKDGNYILMTVEYDENVWPGPPHSTSDKVVQNLYGERCNIEIMEENFTTKTDNIESKDKPAQDLSADEKPTSFGAAVKMSSFIADRWYWMTFK